MAQWAKAFVTKTENMSLILWNPYGVRREPTPASCHLTSTHTLCICAHIQKHHKSVGNNRDTKRFPNGGGGCSGYKNIFEAEDSRKAESRKQTYNPMQQVEMEAYAPPGTSLTPELGSQ